jgi:hypothetical protein
LEFGFVLSPEPCCVAFQADASNSKALQSTTNGSTQHERNTPLPGSFASNLDTDTIGLFITLILLGALVLATACARSKQKTVLLATILLATFAGIVVISALYLAPRCPGQEALRLGGMLIGGCK